MIRRLAATLAPTALALGALASPALAERAVVMVSGVMSITPFTTPDSDCAVGYAAGDTHTVLRAALLAAGHRVYTAPVMLGGGVVVEQDGAGGPFGDCPAPLPAAMTVDSIGPVDAGASQLVRLIDFLHRDHGVTEIDVVGHSLGGLFGRALVRELRLGGSPVAVRSLTTIGTPWTGAMIANPRAEGEPLSACDGLPICEGILGMILSAPGIGMLVAMNDMATMQVWNAAQAGALDGIPVTLIAGDHFRRDGGDAAYWPNDGLVQWSAAVAQGLPEAVLPLRRCATLDSTHSMVVSGAMGMGPATGLTGDPQVAALIDAAIRGTGAGLGDCPAP